MTRPEESGTSCRNTPGSAAGLGRLCPGGIRRQHHLGWKATLQPHGRLRAQEYDKLALVKSRAVRRITARNAQDGVELCNHVDETELPLGQSGTDRRYSNSLR
jgi:hypothetical protein